MDLIEAIAAVSKVHRPEPILPGYIDTCAEDGETWPCSVHVVQQAAESFYQSQQAHVPPGR